MVNNRHPFECPQFPLRPLAWEAILRRRFVARKLIGPTAALDMSPFEVAFVKPLIRLHGGRRSATLRASEQTDLAGCTVSASHSLKWWFSFRIAQGWGRSITAGTTS